MLITEGYSDDFLRLSSIIGCLPKRSQAFCSAPNLDLQR